MSEQDSLKEFEDLEDGKLQNPVEDFLRMDRIPHIWCSGCGIGTVVTSFVNALQKSDLDLDNVAIVSGIGCTGRVAGYVKLDSFHTTHGRAIPFATGLKLANPKSKVLGDDYQLYGRVCHD
jgi:2-oxoglutarate/2-oxoacid ferredoxin oxidoreductase subunit beta